jgi:hypothetical protein
MTPEEKKKKGGENDERGMGLGRKKKEMTNKKKKKKRKKKRNKQKKGTSLEAFFEWITIVNRETFICSAREAALVLIECHEEQFVLLFFSSDDHRSHFFFFCFFSGLRIERSGWFCLGVWEFLFFFLLLEQRAQRTDWRSWLLLLFVWKNGGVGKVVVHSEVSSWSEGFRG